MAQRVKKAPSLTPEQKLARKNKCLRKFRAIARLVMANMFWLADVDELRIGDNVMKNIAMLTRKKVKKSSLTLQEKAILSKPKEARTEEEKQILSKVIGGLKCFRRYPPNVKSQLAAVTYFCYYGPGRQIVKQDHPPSAMYFILSGEASVMVRHYDKFLKEWIEEDSGTMVAGTMFGEVALLHGIVRLATITTLTPCELLMIKKEDFDLVLKDTVLKAWDEIKKIMNRFSYFKNWDAVTKRECSIVSRTKTFSPQETLLGDDCGLPTWVHFITKGSCYIVEELVLKVTVERGVEKFQIIYKKNSDDINTMDAIQSCSSDLRKKEVKPTGKASKSTKYKFQDDNKAKNVIETGIKYSRIETHFIKVCDLTEGACFNIGENFERRRIVAKTQVHVLLVPRYWIIKNNKDNIWNRVQQFLNKHIPTTKQIFKNFMEQRKFMKYRKSLIRDLLAEKMVANENSIHNVPYSIRLEEGVDTDYYI